MSHLHSLHKHVKHHVHKPLSWVVFFSVIFLALISIVLIYVFFKANDYKNVIYPNVYINGVHVGGKTQEEVQEAFKTDTQKLQAVQMQVFYEKQPIATFSAEQLALQSNIKDISLQAYLIGRSTHTPTRYKETIFTILGLESYRFNTDIQYKKDEIESFIKITEDAYNKKPKNALFSFENGRVSNFQKDEPGIVINTEKFMEDIAKAFEEIEKEPANKTITLTNKVVPAEITLAEANTFGIEELIGEGKSDYTGSSADRIYNLTLATSKFNGVIIPPGEEFSFNKTIGDISSSTGYRPSYVIKNGQTVLGDGGGVCQVSTTVFRAALNTGLPITERHAHAYRVSYYENDAKPGFDATIYTPSVDFRFKNNTPAHILIQTEIDEENRILTFKFYGKSDGRKVELSDATVWDVAPPPPDREQEDPTLPRGQRKQADYAAWGAKSKFTYKVTKGDTILFEEEYYSSYRPWQAVFLVGTKD